MKRNRLRNLYLKKKTDTSRIAQIKQRNYCLSYLRKTKKDHYANLNEKDVAFHSVFIYFRNINLKITKMKNSKP